MWKLTFSTSFTYSLPPSTSNLVKPIVMASKHWFTVASISLLRSFAYAYDFWRRFCYKLSYWSRDRYTTNQSTGLIWQVHKLTGDLYRWRYFTYLIRKRHLYATNSYEVFPELNVLRQIFWICDFLKIKLADILWRMKNTLHSTPKLCIVLSDVSDII